MKAFIQSVPSGSSRLKHNNAFKTSSNTISGPTQISLKQTEKIQNRSEPTPVRAYGMSVSPKRRKREDRQGGRRRHTTRRRNRYDLAKSWMFIIGQATRENKISEGRHAAVDISPRCGGRHEERGHESAQAMWTTNATSSTSRPTLRPPAIRCST